MANPAITFPITLDTSTTVPNNRTSGGPSPVDDNNSQANAILALEAKVGVNSSTDSTSLDYKTLYPFVKRILTVTYTATITPNASITDILRVTLTGNVIMNVPTGTFVDGQQIQYELTQDSTGSRTISFGTGYGFSTDLPSPTLTTTANKTDILGFEYNAVVGVWRCMALLHAF